MTKISLLKKLDGCIAPVLANLLPEPSAPSVNVQPKSILMIRPGGIGDAVHLIPVIQTLQKLCPEITVDILAEQRNAGAFVLCPGIRQVFLYDSPSQLLRVLRNRYDVVMDTEQWHRLSAVVARLVRSRVKIGYATNERTRLFTHAIPYSHDDYEVVSFLNLLEPLGVTSEAPPEHPWLQIPAAAHQAAETLLDNVGREPFVVLFPGASIVEKRWSLDNFIQVAGWCREQRLSVVIVGGNEDRAAGDALVSDARAINLAGRTSLAETAAIISRARVIVSGDSGVLHIAAGLDCATVALFGPGSPAKWAPRGPRHIVLNAHLPCSPCTRFGYTPPCPINARCMTDIKLEDVTGAIAQLLERFPVLRNL